MDTPVKAILIGCGALAGLAVLGVVAIVLVWSRSSPKSEAARADQETTVGDPAGAQVIIPAGAVDRAVKIEISPRAPETRTAPGAKVVGKVWSFQVDGQDRFNFKKPVRLAVPIDRALVKDGAAVVLSRWDKTRWRKVPRSRVEGDRVVADVDHFSEYAPTQDDGAPAGMVPPDAPYAAFLNAESWTGQIDITIQGSWGGRTAVSSYQWDVSRSASASFRIPVRLPVILGGKGRWISPLKSENPDDRAHVSATVNDTGYDTDDDYDRNGNVYHYRTDIGSNSSQHAAHAQLEIDPQAGTYTLSNAFFGEGKVMTTEWSTFGDTRPKTYESPLRFNGSLGPRMIQGDGVITDTIPLKTPAEISRIEPSPDKQHPSIHGTMKLTLTPGPAALGARIVAPPVIRRGDLITLDGSTSTGSISEYQWTFKIGAGCPVEAGRVTRMTGEKVTFHALWNFHAELVVKDGTGKTSTDTEDISVKPRRGGDWETKFKTKRGDPVDSRMLAGPTDLAVSTDWPPERERPAGVPQVGGIQIGVNQCVKHPSTFVSGHRLHTTDPENKIWVEVGYDLLRVGDDGPFHGLFFVSKQRLEVDRVERVNAYLQNPNSELYAINARHHNDNRPAVRLLLKQALEHEKLHSTLTREELDRLRRVNQDPSMLLEAVIGLQLDSTKRVANKSVQDSELKLLLASNDEKVKERLQKDPQFLPSVTIWLPLIFNDGTTKKEIEVDRNFGELYKIGDE